MSTPTTLNRFSLGSSEFLAGRSRTCPLLATTSYSSPKKRSMVRALVGDSTIIKVFVLLFDMLGHGCAHVCVKFKLPRRITFALAGSLYQSKHEINHDPSRRLCHLARLGQR